MLAVKEVLRALIVVMNNHIPTLVLVTLEKMVKEFAAVPIIPLVGVGIILSSLGIEIGMDDPRNLVINLETIVKFNRVESDYLHLRSL